MLQLKREFHVSEKKKNEEKETIIEKSSLKIDGDFEQWLTNLQNGPHKGATEIHIAKEISR